MDITKNPCYNCIEENDECPKQNTETRRAGSLHYDYVETANVNGKKEHIGKTYAKLDCCGFDAIDTIVKLLRNSNTRLRLDVLDYYSDEDVDVNPDIAKKYLMRPHFTGWSKTNVTSGDVYDKKKGEDIAKNRCLDKYHKQYNKRLCTFLSEIRFVCATVEHYLDKHDIDYSKVQTVENMKETKLS